MTPQEIDTIEIRIDRAIAAMQNLRSALANWHTAIVLERPSAPARLEQVRVAKLELVLALGELGIDDDDDDDDGIDRTYDEECA